MLLPEMQYPLYECKILSQDKPIQFRPFTVREEKIMRMGLEGGSIDSILGALKQIINNCVTEPLDTDNLAVVDMETLFLHLRARSMGEMGNQYFKCKNEIIVEDKGQKECGMLIDIPINFLQVPIINTDRSREIRFGDEMGVRMKYPTLGLTKMLADVEEEDIETTIVANCIDVIYTKKEVFYAKDATPDELMEFVLKLPTDKYELLKEFSLNTPRTQLIVEQKCMKCGYDHKITLEGIQDFFE